MKTKLLIVIVLFCMSVSLFLIIPKSACALDEFDKRAVWFSYLDLLEFDYSSESNFRSDFTDAVKKVKTYFVNTVIVHVRPFADALYETSDYPVSQMITGQTELSFDPLTTMIDVAKEEDLLIEAWINPYRICGSETTFKQFVNYSKYSEWIDDDRFVLKAGEYQYIFNPASESVRNMIVSGVEDIVKRYNIDGIHFDDYFYVDGTMNGTTQEQRKESVNQLIQSVYKAIKDIKSEVTFGISPQGNYENATTSGADIDTWLGEEGYIDYLMPQLYWSDQYGENQDVTMFSNRAQLYAKIKRNKNVKLYAGLALYRAGTGVGEDRGWENATNHISTQVQTLFLKKYDGYSLFDYRSFLNSDGIKEMDELLKVHPLTKS